MKKFTVDNLKNSEVGQAMVEYALVATMFFTTIFVLIDVSWIGFQYISFDYSYRITSWELSVSDPNIDVSYTVPEYTASNLLLNGIRENAVGVDTSKIKILNPSIKLSTQKINLKYPDGSDRIEKRRYMNIEAEIIYEFSPLTPIGQTLFGKKITISKNLERLRLLQAKR